MGDQHVARTLLTAPGDCDDGEAGGMNGSGTGNRSTRRKPALTPLCPPEIQIARPRREPRPPLWEASNYPLQLWHGPNFSVTQGYPNILWKPKVRRRVHKSPPLVPTISQMNSVLIEPPYFSKVHSNTMLPLAYRSS
jgi:hypothetical protein